MNEHLFYEMVKYIRSLKASLIQPAYQPSPHSASASVSAEPSPAPAPRRRRRRWAWEGGPGDSIIYRRSYSVSWASPGAYARGSALAPRWSCSARSRAAGGAADTRGACAPRPGGFTCGSSYPERVPGASCWCCSLRHLSNSVGSH